MVDSIHDIAFGMHHVVCIGIPHGHVVCFCDDVVCFSYASCGMYRHTTWPCGMILWPYGMFFQNRKTLQIRIFKGEKWLKRCHIKKTKRVWLMGSYSTLCKSNCTTPNLHSHVALLGTRFVMYGPMHHIIIWFSLIWYRVLPQGERQFLFAARDGCVVVSPIFSTSKIYHGNITFKNIINLVSFIINSVEYLVINSYSVRVLDNFRKETSLSFWEIPPTSMVCLVGRRFDEDITLTV